MNKNIDVVRDIWHSHRHYLADRSVDLQNVNVIDYLAGLFCPGPYYYYVIDSPTLTLDLVSESVRDIFGIEPDDFSLDDLVKRVHPDDVEFFFRCEDVVAHFLRNCIPPEKVPKYKITYTLRLRVADLSWHLFLLQTVTMQANNDGSLLKVFGSQTDISHITSERKRTLSLIGLDGEDSWLNVDVYDPAVFDDFTPYRYPALTSPFSRRETEVARLLVEGHSTASIAEVLGISPQTVSTHRKHLLRKSAARNTPELIAKCLTEGFL